MKNILSAQSCEQELKIKHTPQNKLIKSWSNNNLCSSSMRHNVLRRRKKITRYFVNISGRYPILISDRCTPTPNCTLHSSHHHQCLIYCKLFWTKASAKCNNTNSEIFIFAVHRGKQDPQNTALKPDSWQSAKYKLSKTGFVHEHISHLI